MEIREIIPADRPWLEQLYSAAFELGGVLVQGVLKTAAQSEGFLLFREGELVGFATYEVDGDVLQIIALKSLVENKGNGNALLKTILNKAIDDGFAKVRVFCTNDNLRGLRFFQRMGFSMVKLHRGRITQARKRYPNLPLYSDFIRVEHEIELEQPLM